MYTGVAVHYGQLSDDKKGGNGLSVPLDPSVVPKCRSSREEVCPNPSRPSFAANRAAKPPAGIRFFHRGETIGLGPAVLVTVEEPQNR